MAQLEETILSSIGITRSDLLALAATITVEDRTRLSENPLSKGYHKKLVAQHSNLVTLGRLRYDTGDYATAAALMTIAVKMAFEGGSPAATDNLLWGALASLALARSKAWAIFVANRIADRIDHQPRHASNPKALLKSRLWLLHWALFAFFAVDLPVAPAKIETEKPSSAEAEKTSAENDVTSAEEGKTSPENEANPAEAEKPLAEAETAQQTQIQHMPSYLDFVGGNDRLFNAAKLSAPYLLRYVAAAAVLKRKRRAAALEAALRQEAHRYSDVITEVVGDIITGADGYAERKEVLGKCADVMAADYFLAPHSDAFCENARTMLLDVFIRTSQSFSAEFVRAKLGFETVEETLAWMEKRAFLPLAKETAEDGKVVFVVQVSSSSSNYLQTIAKYRSIFYKTKILGNSIAEIGHPGGEGTNNNNNNNNNTNNKKMRKQ